MHTMKKAILFTASIAFASTVFAQTTFRQQVHIEFEKSANLHAFIKEVDPEWYEDAKDRVPKTTTNYSEFTGNAEKSIYKPGREVAANNQGWWLPVADKNVIYTDYKTGTYVAQRPVFEEVFLVKDSLLKIKWQITPDTRTIAGYECRKAVGILDDTVAVFAFYTDEIMIPGGPEGIQGLPGMILGMGVPRLHATWFATKVEVFDVKMNAVVPATKGKLVNRASMMQELGKILREWGSYGSKFIINFTI